MYRLQEATLNLPEVQQDRSVNVLSLVEPGSKQPFQIVINRDELLGQETIPECFDRQMGLLQRQVKSFKVIQRHMSERPGKQALYTMESTFTQGGKPFHQWQAMLTMDKPRILVITLSSHLALKEGHRKIWDDLLRDLDPSAPAA